MNIDSSTRILIVEDNPGFTHLLEILLHEIGLSQIQVASDYEKGLAAFEKFEPDICILDIDLGKGVRSGIQLAEQIRKTHQYLPIIFITSNYNEEFYQMTRFTFPSAFLSKELSRFKIEHAIDLALMHRQERSAAANRVALNPVPYITQQQFFFKIGDIYKAIPIKDVSYFYSDNKLTFAKIDQRNYPTNVQLKTLEEEFNYLFVRLHKSYLVNIEQISAVHPKESTVLIGQETLPIGYAYRSSFLGRLNLLR